MLVLFFFPSKQSLSYNIKEEFLNYEVEGHQLQVFYGIVLKLNNTSCTYYSEQIVVSTW